MTPAPVPRIGLNNLLLGNELGGGGQGKVTEVTGLVIGGRWPAVLKTYNAATVNPDKAVLERIVAFPAQLAPGDSTWLHEHTAWPAVIAEDSGVIRGFLMRAVPDAYYFGFRTRTRGTRRQLADVAFLLNTDQYVTSAGLSVSDRDRLALLTSLAGALSRLHSLDIVVGDLSPKNLLFSLAPAPDCFIIDCDAMCVRGETVLPQIQTPDWEVPTGETTATSAADAYKFGLLATRLFARDQSSRDPAALSAFAPELGRLAQASLQHDPSQRPAPRDWIPALAAASAAVPARATTATTPPVASPRISISVPSPMVTTTTPPPSAPTGPRRPASAPGPPAPRRRGRRIAATWLVTVLGVATVALVIVIGMHATTNPASSGDSSGNSISDIPTSGSASSASSAPPARPTRVGVVRIGNSISADPEAMAVASMFNTYFTGINSQDYQQALSVFDPSGIIDPNNSSQAQQFTQGVSTSRDSAAVLVKVEPADGSTVQSAKIRFTSRQQAGYGPQDDPNATCTNWKVTYILSQDSSGSYLINSVSSSNHSSC